MQRVSLIIFSALILWSFYIGLGGDAFTYYLAIGLFICGGLGIIATLNVRRICHFICGESGFSE